MSESGVLERNNINNNSSYSYSVADPGLLDRTAYTNASVALHHIEKVDTCRDVDGTELEVGGGGKETPPPLPSSFDRDIIHRSRLSVACLYT